MTTTSASFDSALKKFGLESFRPGQREVIESIVSGDDCMCIMPTGGGKSLCYQLPSVIRPGLTIVVSPLIALMKDQVDALGKRGIPAALVNSTLTQSEQTQRLADVTSGRYQLVYVAPERLRNSRFLEAIRATPIQLLAIDEAHCISQWGHDFRPDYARIGKFREWLGGVQTVALTATATPRVRDDIVQVLGLKRPKQFMSGFARPNLHFGVVQRQTEREKDEELEGFLKQTNGSGIIYAATRKRCEALVDWIGKKLKVSVGAYHAGLMPDQRRGIQERFMRNELRVIVATNAFGMGIDKPDLRFVIHYNMPGSLEAYYQEAGRAGRDGLQSICVLLYSFQDRYIQEFFIENNYPPKDVIQKVYEFLVAREEDPIELTLEEIRDALGLSISPEAIGSGLQVLGRTGVLERLEMGGGLAMVKIDSNLSTLVELLPREARVQRKVLRVLEQAIGDRRGEQVYVHPRWLLQQTELERDPLNRALRELCRLEEVDYVPPFRGRAIHFTRRGVAFDDLSIDFEALGARKQAEYDRLNQVVSYAQSPLCRQATIMRYFGDTSAENCGQCDRCGRSPGWPLIKLPACKPLAAGGEQATCGQSQSGNAAEGVAVAANSPRTGARHPRLSESQRIAFLDRLLTAIERIHGRIGKILIAQYLSGSQNAKLHKLNLHRLSGFGMLVAFRQSDSVELLDVLMAAGLLRQQEVSRHRPTVSVAPELANAKQRMELLSGVQLPPRLEAKIVPIVKNEEARDVQESCRSSDNLSSQTVATLVSPRPLSVPPEATGGEAAAAPTSLFPLSGQSASERLIPPLHPSSSDSDFSREGQAAPKTSLHAPPTGIPDWSWTLGLFVSGHRWGDVLLIRRMSDEQLAASLCEALRAGKRIERQWLNGEGDQLRSAGQQQLLRELRRQSTAWVN